MFAYSVVQFLFVFLLIILSFVQTILSFSSSVVILAIVSVEQRAHRLQLIIIHPLYIEG